MQKPIQILVICCILMAGSVCQAYFEDTFGGAALDTRWTNDNSPVNLNDPNYNNVALYPDGNPSIIRVAGGVAKATVTHLEAYNHLETSIDASGEFYVQVSSRVDEGAGVGANHLAVYWDNITYIMLVWGKNGNLTVAYSDGENYYEKTTAESSAGWEMVTLKLEFTADKIKCYAKHGTATGLTYWSVLDIPRVASFKQASALMIIGKGTESPSDYQPDMDNDQSVVNINDELIIDNAYYQPLGYSQTPEFFIDPFDGSDLNARWSRDNSLANVNDEMYAGGSEIAIVGGQAVASPTHQEAYNHLETPVDGSKNFAVQIDSRVDTGMGVGANHLAVYWDNEHWISLSAGRYGYIKCLVRDDSGITTVNTGQYYPGWGLVTMRIEFLDDTIKFYSYVHGDDDGLVYQPQMDMLRASWTKQPIARMIIGKGEQLSAEVPGHINPPIADIANPDFDNDDVAAGVGGDDALSMDNASYEALGTYECGNPGTVYLDGDLNKDCSVDINDMAMFAGSWLWCSNPQNSDCDQYWKTVVYFDDQFDMGTLDARWTEDNSSQNPSGSNFTLWTLPGWLVDAYPGLEGHQLSSETNKAEAYHHIQTTIETTANFSVATSLRCSSGVGVGAGHLAVYWDATHYVGLAAGRGQYVSRELYDGTSLSTLANSYEYSVGYAWYSLKIEFTDTAVKFYIGKSGAESLADPNYHPELDMVRESWMTADALLVAGKGTGVGGGLDFDNDNATIGADELYIDFVSYQPPIITQCSDPGAVHFAADINQDCNVDFKDFAEFAKQWFWCTDPKETECDKYWR